MADRQITFTTKDADGDILTVDNPAESWGPRIVLDVAADISGGQHTYFTIGTNATRTDVHVVNGPRTYIRSDPDGQSDNNLNDIRTYDLPTYLGDYPDDFDATWSHKLQGVAHSDDHWFFTQETKIFKFPVLASLGSQQQQGSWPPIARMPSALYEMECNHFGDPDYFVHNGQGWLVVPVHGSDGNMCDDVPQLALFADNGQSLDFVGAAPLTRNGIPVRAGWCAVHPQNGLLYTSFNSLTLDRPLFRFSIEYDLLDQGEVAISYSDDLLLLEGGAPVHTPTWMQGGCFSPDGWLFLSIGRLANPLEGEFDNAEGEDRMGIWVFDRNGELHSRSSRHQRPFLYRLDTGILSKQEPEGITFWDLDGIGDPHAEGQLHAILLNKDHVPPNDNFWLKHYRIWK